MENNKLSLILIILFTILIFFCSLIFDGKAFADDNSTQNATSTKKESLKNKVKKCFKKKNKNVQEEQPFEQILTEPTEPFESLGIGDDIKQEKQKAIENANKDLSNDYQMSEKQTELFENIVEESIEKEAVQEKVEENINKVEGYIQETVILSLDDCIRKALENNPDIRSAFNNSEIYRSKVMQAWSNYFPTFSMTNGLTRNRYLTINFSVQDQEYTFYNAMNLSGSQLIFDFGQTKSLADTAKKTYEASQATFNSTISNIVYDVKDAYYYLLFALEKQQVYLDTIKSYEQQLKQAQLFYKTGVKSKIDVTMAQYNLGTAQLGYVKATNEVSIAKSKLNNAMGMPRIEDYKILDRLSMTEYVYNFEYLLQKAYETSSTLLAYKKKAEASKVAIRSYKRAFFPRFEAVGAFSVGGGTQFTDDYGWTVGAQFTYNNINWLKMKKQVDESVANFQKSMADLESASNNLHLQVEQAYVQLKNAQESIPITALSLKHAKEQYHLSSGRYKAGAADAVELKDSEVTYRNARLNYLEALLQYNLSVAYMEKVTGTKLIKK